MKSTASKYDENWNSYDYYSYVHNVSFFYYQGYAHQNWGFLPWHRQFLLYLERELQFFSGNDSLRLPYWNPEDEISTFYTLYDTSFIGGDGNPINPKSGISCDKFQIDPRLIGNYLTGQGEFPERNGNGTCIIRDINGASHIIDLPNIGEWDLLIDKQLPYDIYPYTNTSFTPTNISFRVDLEGRYHGSMHIYCGGDLGRSLASPVDPVFFMIHAWIDLIWWKYQKKYGIYSTFPEELLNIQLFESRIDNGLFYFDSSVTANDVMHANEIGYDYDITQSSDSEPWYKSNTFIIISVLIASILACIIVSFIVYKSCKCKKRHTEQEIETQSLL
eukprot:320034_1